VSALDDDACRAIADPRAVSVASVNVTNSRGQTVLKMTPNEFPANTFRAQKELGDDGLIDYIQVGSETAKSVVYVLICDAGS
jgi:Arf-GAP with SH3 domain, ANK repeat and PH domain-containing protein